MLHDNETLHHLRQASRISTRLGQRRQNTALRKRRLQAHAQDKPPTTTPQTETRQTTEHQKKTMNTTRPEPTTNPSITDPITPEELVAQMKTSQNVLMEFRRAAWEMYSIGCEFESDWRAKYLRSLIWVQDELTCYPGGIFNAAMI
jgi:hypothetical protein